MALKLFGHDTSPCVRRVRILMTSSISPSSLRGAGTGARPDVQQTLWLAALDERDVDVFTVLDGGLDAAINGFCSEQAGCPRAQNGYLQRQFDRA